MFQPRLSVTETADTGQPSLPVRSLHHHSYGILEFPLSKIASIFCNIARNVPQVVPFLLICLLKLQLRRT